SLRVVALVQVHALPNATSDGLFYQATAQAIVTGGLAHAPRAFAFSQLYIFFLAAVWKVFGFGLNVVRVLQLALGVGSCGLTFLIADRLFGRRVGLAAIPFAALYVPSVRSEL